MKKYRLAILTSHPIQYQAPIWRALAQSSEVEPMVYFLYDHGTRKGLDPEFGVEFKWDVPLLHGYEYKFHSSNADSSNSSISAIRALVKDLRNSRVLNAGTAMLKIAF